MEPRPSERFLSPTQQREIAILRETLRQRAELREAQLRERAAIRARMGATSSASRRLATNDSQRFLERLDANSRLVTKIKEEAQKPDKYPMEEFYGAIKDHLGEYEFACMEKFLALYDLYLGYHNQAMPEQPDPPIPPPHHWSGVGPVTDALAPGARVVDAVFSNLKA